MVGAGRDRPGIDIAGMRHNQCLGPGARRRCLLQVLPYLLLQQRCLGRIKQPGHRRLTNSTHSQNMRPYRTLFKWSLFYGARHHIYSL